MGRPKKEIDESGEPVKYRRGTVTVFRDPKDDEALNADGWFRVDEEE